MEPTMVLSLVSVAFVQLLFGMAMLQKRAVDPLWMTMNLAVVLLYASLCFDRLRELHAELRRRLRNAAAALAMLLSALFFYNFTAGMSWWTAVAVWLFLAAAAYLSYDVVMLDPEHASLYFHRLRELHAGLRRRLPNDAVALAMFLSAFFLYNFASGMSWWTAVAVWLFHAAVAYLSYDVVMLDPELMGRRLPI